MGKREVQCQFMVGMSGRSRREESEVIGLMSEHR